MTLVYRKPCPSLKHMVHIYNMAHVIYNCNIKQISSDRIAQLKLKQNGKKRLMRPAIIGAWKCFYICILYDVRHVCPFNFDLLLLHMYPPRPIVPLTSATRYRVPVYMNIAVVPMWWCRMMIAVTMITSCMLNNLVN